MTEPAIPTVDLADLAPDAGPEARARALNAVREGFATFGLVYAKNHGVGDIAQLYDRFVQVCELPRALKDRYNRDDLWYQRGWTPPETEKAVVGSGQPDFKECWFAAPHEGSASSQLLYPEIFANNVWPEEDGIDTTGFAASYLAAGGELHAAGLKLLEAAALALELPADALTSVSEGGAHVFRMLRYLPLTDAQTKQNILWGEEHTDFNLLTLLPGGRFHDPSGVIAPPPDAGSGLYLRTRPTVEHPEGLKVKGTAPPGCIVAQVGQMLEILTGGTFLATPHVVTAPHTPGWSRLSAAHFVHVHPDTVLFPRPEFRTPETILAYRPPVLAGTYAIKTLVDIGLAPANAIERLGYRHYDRLGTIRATEATR